MLRADGKALSDWFVGVRIPKSSDDMNQAERERRTRYDQELLNCLGPKDGSSNWWPWWVWIDQQNRHWSSLVPALHRECEAERDGNITRYFVDAFVEIARKAIPVVDDIEA